MLPLRMGESSKQRDSWEACEMERAADTFESLAEVRLWCGTYNVNGKREGALMLSHWLKQGWDEKVPDLFVISLQEMIDLSATNVVKEAVTDSLSRRSCDEWIDVLQQAFELLSKARPGVFQKPSLVAREHMCGIAIFCFAANSDLAWFDVATARIPTGAAGGRLGNKGACAIRMRLYSSTLCLVGAHLSAHRSDVEARNADYQMVVERRCFKRDRLGGAVSGLVSTNSPSTLRSCCSVSTAPTGLLLEADAACKDFDDAFTVLDHDVLIFFGDLNYRIVKTISDKEVHYLLKADMSKLLASDQLNLERAAKRTFWHGFVEPRLGFAPTYKYVTGTKLYEHETTAESERSASSKKPRCPAWCDRVLYRVALRGPRHRNAHSAERVTCAAYERADDRLCVSDHRAVHAVLDLNLRRLDAQKRANALLKLGPQLLSSPDLLKRMRNSTTPNEFSFASSPPKPDFAYATRASTSSPSLQCRLSPSYIWLRAGVEAKVNLIASRRDKSAHNLIDLDAVDGESNNIVFAFARIPTWLTLQPKFGVINESATTITARAVLDDTAKAALADNRGVLGTTLVLHCGASTFAVPVCLTSSPDWFRPLNPLFTARSPSRTSAWNGPPEAPSDTSTSM